MSPSAIKYCLLAVMFVGLGVLVLLLRMQGRISKRMSMIIAVFISVVVFGAAVSILKLDKWVGERQRKKFLAREIRYQKVGYRRLGREIAERFSGKSLVIIKHVDLVESAEAGPAGGGERTNLTALQLEAFKEGLGSACPIIAVEDVMHPSDYFETFENLKPPENTPSYTAKYFDSLVEKHKDADLFVCLAGLPFDMKDMAFWKEKDPEKRPQLVLAETSPYELKKAIRQDFISLILLRSYVQRADGKEPIPEDDAELFKQEFLFITPDNVDALSEDNPKIFR